jgi:hypothetical protein
MGSIPICLEFTPSYVLLLQQREGMKLRILGQMMLEKMEEDAELKKWIGREIEKRILKKKNWNYTKSEKAQ